MPIFIAILGVFVYIVTDFPRNIDVLFAHQRNTYYILSPIFLEKLMTCLRIERNTYYILSPIFLEKLMTCLRISAIPIIIKVIV